MARNNKSINVELRMIEAEHPGQMPLLEMWIDGERVKSIAPISVNKFSDQEMAVINGNSELNDDNQDEQQEAFFVVNPDGSVKFLSDESTLTDEQKQKNQLLMQTIMQRCGNLPQK